jgi:hypothetical protein
MSFDNNNSKGTAVSIYTMNTYKGNKDTVPLTPILRNRWSVVNITPRAFYLRARNAVPTEKEAGWVSEPVGTAFFEDKWPVGIRTPNGPARSECLYRLHYPDSIKITSYQCLVTFKQLPLSKTNAITQ